MLILYHITEILNSPNRHKQDLAHSHVWKEVPDPVCVGWYSCTLHRI